MHLVLAVNPTLAAWGQAAAIIIGLFALVFILIAVAFNIGLAFAFAWVREKAELVHKLHPTVDNVNQAVQHALQGTPDKDANPVVRNIANVPVGVRTVDRRADEISDRVAKGVIEFRARTAQVVTVARAFIAPRHIQREIAVEHDGRELTLSDRLAGAERERQAPELPIEAPVGDGRPQSAAAAQLRDASAR